MAYSKRVLFSAFAEKSARAAGSPLAFTLAVALLVVWAATGPFFGYSEVWQIVINTITTIITFLLVFLIQSSQNREMRAVQIKLDEMIRATLGAHNAVLDLEKLSEEELMIICAQYETLAQKARQQLREGQTDRDVPDLTWELKVQQE